jgi:uncharacterized DUF497 family protein
MEFEWDLGKAEENVSKHGVTFDDAAKVFLDPNSTEDYDLATQRPTNRDLQKSVSWGLDCCL